MLYIMEHRGPFLDKWKQWNKFSAQSGGTLVEKCCHYFDLFNLLAGARPVRVYGSGAQDVAFRDFTYQGQKADILDNAFVIVDYANGVRASLNLCMFLSQHGREELIVNGDLGSVYATDTPNDSIEFLGGSHDLNRTIEPRAHKKVAATGTHAGATYYEHLCFYDCVRTGKQAPITAVDGLWSVAVGALAEESVRERRPVDIPESLQRFS
jgi:predicted dehydrogenase